MSSSDHHDVLTALRAAIDELGGYQRLVERAVVDEPDLGRTIPSRPRHDLDYKASTENTLYRSSMASRGDLRVSSRGQMSLPATVRRRWGLVDGGEVAYVDLGESLLIVPGSAAELRRELLASVSNRDWRQARSGFGDPDLANE